MREGWERVQSAIADGASFVRASVGRVPLFASVEASVQHDDVARDETHYFLIPTPFSEAGYALYNVRRLPEGYAAANDLPELRVFHLPGPGGEATLESLVLANHVGPAIDDDTTFADRLSIVADEIDRHGRQVTGGLLVIGGVVALANPLLGVGIAAKAVFPSVGALLSREGLKLAGDRLKSWGRNRRVAQQENEAKKAIRLVPSKAFVNPILADLERALRTDEAEFDPSFDTDFDLVDADGWNRAELVQLTAQAIVATYGSADGPALATEFKLGPEDRRWLETLRTLAGG